MLFHLVYSTWNYGHCSVPHTLITFMKQLLVLACQSLAPCEVFWRRATRYCVLRAFLGLYFGFWTEVILLCHSLCSFSKPQTNHGKNICTKYLGSTICAISIWIQYNDIAGWCKVSFLFNCSGTLSYIFNNFEGTRTFSNVVAEAKEAGYTEPDPRDDLSGTDVARKVELIFCSDTILENWAYSFWYQALHFD